MMNRFLLISITLATALLTGCDGDRKAAQARLEKARAMYEKGEFFAAKNEIDSLRGIDAHAESGDKRGGAQHRLLR